MSESGPTYEQAPAFFEAARQWQAIAETATSNAAQASLRVAPFDALARAMFERHAREAGIYAATFVARGIAALAQPPLRDRERMARKAWEARILASLRAPRGEERAQIAAWLSATHGETLPLL